uniref:Uncharacterized protein n=1 Tax=Kalanchoe fedtschenkoi TaxID=63787 RepID=A0A7N0TC85_KALFE
MGAAGGKCLLFSVYFVFVLGLGCGRGCCSGVEGEIGSSDESESLLDRQRAEIRKLEELVMNLSEIVGKLESKLLPVVGRVHRFDDGGVDADGLGLGDVSGIDAGKVGKVKSLDAKKAFNKAESVEREKKAFSVKKYSPFWSEKFQFEAAVKLDSEATCVNVLPFKDFEGLSKYFAVGDEKGRIYVFLRNGDVSFEFDTTSHSPILSMVSYLSAYKNESVVVTGHWNGEIKMHRIWEASGGEDWSSLMMEYVRDIAGPVGGEEDIGSGGSGDVVILEVHHVGRMKYILSSDGSGTIKVYRENGMLHGSVIPSSKPIVFLKQRLLFLTETGAGSLDLRAMRVKESECEGLNRSRVRNYVFDAAERSKAYGFTSEGEMIHVLLLGDVMNFKCRVRSKRKFEMEEPLVLQAIKGYLLVVNQEKVFVYNVSSQHYVRAGSPRLLFSAGIDEIRATFLNTQAMDSDGPSKVLIPLVASDKEKLVVIGLGDGYVGLYRSNLPIFKSESSTILWTSPVLFFIIFLFAAWHFFAKKKEVLTAWGPDDPFTSASAMAGTPLGSGAEDRSFTDGATRNTDLMELRSGGGLRGPSRRYASPSRYQGGSANSFRPGSADLSSRPASVDPSFRNPSELKYRGSPLDNSGDLSARPAAGDPSFRNPSELKYRGSALDNSGFPKRREGLFANSQVGEDVS